MALSHPPSDKFEDLLRRAELTSKARYECARRLEHHELASQWTLAALVVGHIVIALVLALELDTSIPEKTIHFSAVFIGVVVLTYSLLLGLGRFSVRAKEMHLCGLELGRIARHLHAAKGTAAATDSTYEDCLNRYYDCLTKYDNHGEIDYSRAAFDYYTARTSEPAKNKKELTKLMCTYHRHYLFQFSHYALSLALVWGWSLYLLWPTLHIVFGKT